MSFPALRRGAPVLTLQAVVHREMLGLFKSPAHDWTLEECVDGVHLVAGGLRLVWLLWPPGCSDPQFPAPDPGSGLWVLTPGDGRNPRSGQGWEQRSYLVKEMFQAAVKLVLLV